VKALLRREVACALRAQHPAPRPLVRKDGREGEQGCGMRGAQGTWLWPSRSSAGGPRGRASPLARHRGTLAAPPAPTAGRQRWPCQRQPHLSSASAGRHPACVCVRLRAARYCIVRNILRAPMFSFRIENPDVTFLLSENCSPGQNTAESIPISMLSSREYFPGRRTRTAELLFRVNHGKHQTCKQGSFRISTCG
jgi:hypothetical protein